MIEREQGRSKGIIDVIMFAVFLIYRDDLHQKG